MLRVEGVLSHGHLFFSPFFCLGCLRGVLKLFFHIGGRDDVDLRCSFYLYVCYVWKVFFNIGRDSAVEGLRYKVISFGLIVSCLTFLSVFGGEDAKVAVFSNTDV